MQKHMEAQARQAGPRPANDHDGTGPEPPQDPDAYPGRDVRQGEIIINTPLRRRLFFGGLIAIPVFVIVIAAISIATS
ncbi:hypothetical protein [Aquisalinus flavus]|uniref:Uncharacterized protein n=1 Tax=Aquisalinus flavus TaxID=1526572 RepID=A0A8J2V184_9PROT|nr:hypothetical protein [Aquisalinus flavus]MBD0427724.1 hypothetical protein [Aquisalinus flavus]UNE47502.1 hypothetical protein FF099_05240 [Aquisalinus flavus]GGD03303.1 hypothetical protein GCM10011342_10390 [Aquisalinus flavus]